MTAVNNIIEFCKEQKNIDVSSHRGAYSTIIKFCEEHAKELERQQIIDAYRKSTYQFSVDAQIDCPKSAEQYYNETFNK